MRHITKRCDVIPEIEGMKFDFTAYPIDKLGEVKGKEVDVLIGAGTMEDWSIKIDLEKDELDLSGLKKKVFTEFFN